MLVSRLKVEIPDNCPDGCQFRGQPEQGGACHRCPVFNCRPIRLTEDEHKEIGGSDAKGPYTLRMLEPEDYRDDWAVEWGKFFRGETECPRLNLFRSVEHEYEAAGIQGDVPGIGGEDV